MRNQPAEPKSMSDEIRDIFGDLKTDLKRAVASVLNEAKEGIQSDIKILKDEIKSGLEWMDL